MSNWYKSAKLDLPKEIKTLEDFLEWMDNIEYGWMNSDFEKQDGFGDEFWNEYSMLLPEEVLEHRLGVCWDQVIFENAIFDKYFNKYEHKIFFIQQYGVSTHTFLAFRDDGIMEDDPKWFYFEHSYGKYKGIHGPFETIEDIIEKVKENMEKDEKGDGFEWKEIDPNDFKKKLTCKEFMDICGYNYEEMEETDKLIE